MNDQMNVARNYRYEISDVFVSVVLHVVVIMSFFVTFPGANYPVKPYLVFLGSFLSQQDIVYLKSLDNTLGSSEGSNVDLMDVRSGVYSQFSVKPEQENIFQVLRKQQYKPIMAVEPSTKKQNEQGDGFDGDFETIAPVRMEWNFDAQD